MLTRWPSRRCRRLLRANTSAGKLTSRPSSSRAVPEPSASSKVWMLACTSRSLGRLVDRGTEQRRRVPTGAHPEHGGQVLGEVDVGAQGGQPQVEPHVSRRLVPCGRVRAEVRVVSYAGPPGEQDRAGAVSVRDERPGVLLGPRERGIQLLGSQPRKVAQQDGRG